MADNGKQLCIVVPGTGTAYIYTKSGGLTLITDLDFTGIFPDGSLKLAEIVVFIDGYFVFTTASKNFFQSAINDGTNYNALDFGTAEADPDNIRSAHVYKNQLYIFGSETIEVFQTSTSNISVGSSFDRINGFVIPKGIASPFSVVDFDGSFVFAGQGVNESPKIYMFSGSGVVPISNTAIDLILQEAQKIDESFAVTYTFRGAVFVAFSTSTGGTLIYDAKASALSGGMEWHTRESSNLSFKSRWRVNSIITAYSSLLVGDSEGGIIGKIDNDVYTDYGNTISREFALATLENNSQPMFFNSIEAVIDSGQGLEDGTIPYIRMSYSDDGRVYTSEKIRSAGATGQYNIKTKWTQLGTTRRYRIFNFKFDAPVKWTILKMVINLDG